MPSLPLVVSSLSTPLISLRPLLTITTIATPVTSRATVIITGVLGAINADLRRRLATDTTDQNHSFSHFGSAFFRLSDTGALAGVRKIADRHRCASWSIT